MGQGNWIRRYGVHIMICAMALASSFGINRKINLDRSHEYRLSENAFTLLKEVTEAREEGNDLVLSGWGFDTIYCDEWSRRELILQDTETGEDLWLKMERNPEPVKIPDPYVGGEDYSGAGFEGRIKADRLGASRVYEILLRYSSDYLDEEGDRQAYVRTVSTGRFLYQGGLSDYNPKTFLAPDVAGTELERKLEGARLFHYFPEGMWVYYDDEKLYYVIESALIEGHGNAFCPVHWMVRDTQDLPEDRRQYGFGNSDFRVDSQYGAFTEDGNYWAAEISLASDLIIFVETGLFYEGAGWALAKQKQLNN